MEVVLSGKNLELNPTIEHFATEKLSRLMRFNSHLQRVEVVIAHERTHEPNGRFTALANLIADGRLMMRGDDHGQTPQVAVDRLVEQLGERLEREHAQTTDHHRRETAVERRFDETHEGEM
ncbi:MAG TPA: ribosome-associated translation inhibitor RaiA [Chloroflexota bacterium]|nr:ribosome-associated translation inhibitor RaiA [Chloroflexota bacterium]